MVTCEDCGRADFNHDEALWRRSHGLESAVLCSPCYAAGGMHGAGPEGDPAAEELARAFDLLIESCRASGSQMSQAMHDYLFLAERAERRAIAAHEARGEGLAELP